MVRNGLLVDEYGNSFWYVNGKYHREDGPAVERYGIQYWYLNDKLHREDGPAIEYKTGFKAWYLNGIEYSQKEHERLVRLKTFW